MVLVIVGLSLVVEAQTDITRVRLERMADDEINATIIEPGAIVYNEENPHDVRIGDGATRGGWRIRDEQALLQVPSHYPFPLFMSGHPLYLNSLYSIQGVGGTFRINRHSTPVLSIASGRDSVGDVVFSRWEETTGDLIVQLTTASNPPAPVVEYTTSLLAPQWQEQAHTYSVTNATSMSIRVTGILEPGFVRISRVNNERIVSELPIHAPQITTTNLNVGTGGLLVDGPAIINETLLLPNQGAGSSNRALTVGMADARYMPAGSIAVIWRGARLAASTVAHNGTGSQMHILDVPPGYRRIVAYEMAWITDTPISNIQSNQVLIALAWPGGGAGGPWASFPMPTNFTGASGARHGYASGIIQTNVLLDALPGNAGGLDTYFVTLQNRSGITLTNFGAQIKFLLAPQ
ncbi:MAG TPA: hypothetical protein PKE26_11875 [Kiritimatiellia bacterium]|nr:hypothetical protein [Kiritimatiellia bacterium]HMO99799.1 hypothetical protein [Kiritimatiellia bacterium]HMP97222.1 hypothetical protein [Kiritimatiellia bacterium]